MYRILLTGAAGMLGTALRKNLAGYSTVLRLSDIADLGEAADGEEIVQCDLADFSAVLDLVDGCDAIIHLGGQALENTFEVILQSNIRGTYNIYEAARQKGIPRILYGSSNHTTGFHDIDDVLDATAPMRPDCLYAVSKCFGESLARYYFDKYKIETVAVRIGSSFPKPLSRRMLATWLSFDDLTSLVKCVFDAEKVDFTVVYGMSDNDEKLWDNRYAEHLNWHPKDNAALYTEEAFLNEKVDPNDPGARLQGGHFATGGHYEDEH